MKKIICLSVLVLLLYTGTALADSKFEAGLLFGSYQPSFSRVEQLFLMLNFKQEGYTKGYALSYRITPNHRISMQIDFSKYQDPVGIKIKTTTISLLGILDLFEYQNLKIYGGIGVIDYQVKSRQPPFLSSPRTSKHDFGFPWGTVVLLGVATPLGKSCQFKGEIQYVAGSDGKLYGIPLDWDGPKFLLSFEIRF